MKCDYFLIAPSLLILMSSCGNPLPKEKQTIIKADTSVIGKIELYDPHVTAGIDSDATIETIGTGYNWSEGPLWLPATKTLIFSDVPENKIYQWREKDSVRLYLTPSGYTDTAKRLGENGSNGLALDRDGRLLLCQSGNRQVVRMEAALDAPRPLFQVLAANYQGKKFNSPNDLVADSKNNIYFTDPVYGLPGGATDPAREIPFEGVYKISSGGVTSLLIDSIPNPNGIALSPDEKTLYIASSDDKHPRWFAYQLNADGNPVSGHVLLDGTRMKQQAKVKQGADGFKLDKHGNIISAGPDGVNIISPKGELAGMIRVFNRKTSNCAFNEDKSILFITADDLVMRIKLYR